MEQSETLLHDRLTWPEASRLCKGNTALEVSSLTFQWGPTEHVLRRFLGTKAFPHLRVLHVIATSCDDGPIRLFRALAQQGRSLSRLSITSALDLAHTRRIEFTITHASGGGITARVKILSGVPTDLEISYAARAFGIADIFVDR